MVLVRLPHFSDDVGVVRRYRYMLEAFVDKIRGRDPEHWFDAQDSITNLEWVEAVYKEVSYNIMRFTCSHLVSFRIAGLRR